MNRRSRYPKIWVAAFLLTTEAYGSLREGKGDANEPNNL
jgi:hypothetical protein